MAAEQTLKQELGRVIVGFAMRNPGVDVEWPVLQTYEQALYMARAVEVEACFAGIKPYAITNGGAQ